MDNRKKEGGGYRRIRWTILLTSPRFEEEASDLKDSPPRPLLAEDLNESLLSKISKPFILLANLNEFSESVNELSSCRVSTLSTYVSIDGSRLLKRIPCLIC